MSMGATWGQHGGTMGAQWGTMGATWGQHGGNMGTQWGQHRKEGLGLRAKGYLGISLG